MTTFILGSHLTSPAGVHYLSDSFWQCQYIFIMTWRPYRFLPDGRQCRLTGGLLGWQDCAITQHIVPHCCAIYYLCVFALTPVCTLLVLGLPWLVGGWLTLQLPDTDPAVRPVAQFLVNMQPHNSSWLPPAQPWDTP